VTSLTLGRALAAANAVLWAAESRGCTCEVSEGSERFELYLQGAQVSFAIRERQDEGLSKSGYRTKVPTNRLVLVLERRGGGAYEILDSLNAPMQDRLHEIFPRLYRAVIASRVDSRSEEARAARRVLYEAEQATLRQKAAAAEADRLLEQGHRDELISEAQQWRRARDVREYVAALEEAMAGAGPSQASASWIAQANRIALDLDPVPARLAKLGSDPH
jgi:hypothetical protein